MNESSNQNERHSERSVDLKKNNLMQTKLAEKFYGFASDETVMKWIELYSPAFREVVSKQPDFLARFDTEPDTVLEEIGHLLYDKNPHN